LKSLKAGSFSVVTLALLAKLAHPLFSFGVDCSAAPMPLLPFAFSKMFLHLDYLNQSIWICGRRRQCPPLASSLNFQALMSRREASLASGNAEITVLKEATLEICN
jgi:hypothetical protein